MSKLTKREEQCERNKFRAAGAVKIPGYINPALYDKDDDIGYGYWICKMCGSSFYGAVSTKPIHEFSCPLKDRRYAGQSRTYDTEYLVYVVASNDAGWDSPYGHDNINRVREIVKARYWAEVNGK